ncbi:MAG TPA: hypothetical protein DCG72_08940 [Gammaproteobacteria bacterium]|nr:hypothetical protein [Gammaproteobacteria bacterium]
MNSDYDVYMVEGFIRSDLAASNQDTLRLEVSTDGGSTYESTNYQGSVQGADYYVSNLASSTATSYFEFGNSGSNAGSFHQAHFRCWIIDPSSASDRLIVHLQMGGMFRPNLGEGMVTHFGGVWDDTTSAVDAIRFSLRVGNFGSGKMRLYGVK